MRVDWGQLGIGAVAILAMAITLIEMSKNRRSASEPKPERPPQPPGVRPEDLAAIIATAVKAAVSEVARPLNEAVTNNTKALHAMQLTLAEQNGKLEQALHTRHMGGDGS